VIAHVHYKARAAGLALPGCRAADGTVTVNACHLGRELA